MAIVLAPDNDTPIPGDEDPLLAMMTVVEMAEKMHCTPQAIYDREKRDLFSVFPPGRLRGRKYPAFLIHPQLKRRAMEMIKQEFAQAQLSNDLLLAWLAEFNDTLHGVRPVDVLVGNVPGSVYAKHGSLSLLLEAALLNHIEKTKQ